jgi:hypothetical protein
VVVSVFGFPFRNDQQRRPRRFSFRPLSRLRERERAKPLDYET